MRSLMATAVTMGRKVKKKETVWLCSDRNRAKHSLAHGMDNERIPIQKISTTKLDRETVDPTPDKANQTIAPARGYA
jgi:hypothetical protein